MSKKIMSKKFLILGILIALLLYGVYPYYSTYRLFKIVAEGNEEELEERIDFESLKASLNKEISTIFRRKIREDKELADDLSKNIGIALVPTLIDLIMDEYITLGTIPFILTSPITFQNLLLDKKLPIECIEKEWEINGILYSIRYAFFQSPTTFLVKTSIGMKLKFQLQDWTWKLTKITFPNFAELCK